MTTNPVFLFFSTPGNPGPLFLRLTLAAVLFFHTSQRVLGLFGGPGWTRTIAAWSELLHLPAAVSSVIMAAEVLVIISLFLGFLTRLSSLTVVAIMTGAIVILARNGGGVSPGDYELPAMVCAAGVALFFLGGGALSLDRGISRMLLPQVG